MEDDMPDDPVFDMNAFPSLETSHGYHHTNSNEMYSAKSQDFDYLSAKDEVDSLRRELSELHENVLKMSVRAHMLEVDLATQFNPETVLDIRQLEMVCQQCTQVVEKTAPVQTDDTKKSSQDNIPPDNNQTINLHHESAIEAAISMQ